MTDTAASPPGLATMNAARNALDLRMIPIDEIAVDADQPRKRFDAGPIDELGASLKQGQTNAIKVRPRHADDDFPPEIRWVLMHGERRLRAAQKAEIQKLRAEVGWSVAAGDEALILLDQIADNLQHVDLGAVEEASAIRRYAKISGLGTREIAARLGKNQMYVTLAIGMDKMPAELLRRIDRNDRGEGEHGVDAHPLTWKHMRALLRLKDHPAELNRVYDDAIMQRSTTRELEQQVDWELQTIDKERKRAEHAEAEAKRVQVGGGKDAKPTSPKQAPLSTLDDPAQQQRLEKARMTRARKDVIRGMLPDVVHQVARIAKGIKLPDGLAEIAADKVRGHDAWQLAGAIFSGSHQITAYGEDLAQLVVPELPGKWQKSDLGSALNAGGRTKDDEAGRQWLAFVYWLATETKGLDKGLDKAAADILRERDKGTADRATTKAAKAAAKGPSPAPASTSAPAAASALTCARDDCKAVFHIKEGHKGRRPKYCPTHRSR